MTQCLSGMMRACAAWLYNLHLTSLSPWHCSSLDSFRCDSSVDGNGPCFRDAGTRGSARTDANARRFGLATWSHGWATTGRDGRARSGCVFRWPVACGLRTGWFGGRWLDSWSRWDRSSCMWWCVPVDVVGGHISHIWEQLDCVCVCVREFFLGKVYLM